jgi:hypothetical protein
MDTKTKNRCGSVATSIPLFLIVLGIFVWGLQYKLSLYDASGSSSRSLPQAKLLSPSERPDSALTAEQLCPRLAPTLPVHLQYFLITAIFVGILFTQLGRVSVLNPPDARNDRNSTRAFFSFRPPPSFARAQ